MVIYVLLKEDGNIEGWGTSPPNSKAIKVEIEDNHPFLDDMPDKYTIVNGKIKESKNSHEAMMKKFRDGRLKLLSQACQENIVGGFNADVAGVNYHFSYDINNQQNFSDIMRLFENTMIQSIGWNAYLDGEKERIQLNKDEFTNVYLKGVQHKANCLAMLNDYLYPLVEATKTEDELNLIYWGESVYGDDMTLDVSKTIEKKTKKLEVDNSRNANGILELTTLFLMGGF